LEDKRHLRRQRLKSNQTFKIRNVLLYFKALGALQGEERD
jgi:hypothetical protein